MRARLAEDRVAGGWTAVDGLRLHHRRAGQGRPVVFVHGLAVSSRYFVPTMKVLQDRYACFAPDLPGFGLSEGADVPPTVVNLADALAAWLARNDLVTAALVGNSAGCQVIVDCVIRRKTVTGPVVLVGPTVDPAARTSFAQVSRWLRTGLSRDIAQVPLLVRDSYDAGLRRILTTFRSTLRDPVEHKLKQVRQRALVVRGSRDPLVPQRWAEEAAALLPLGSLAVVRGAHHVVNLTHPTELGALLRAFLEASGHDG